MAHRVTLRATGFEQLFYPKKVPLAHQEKLAGPIFDGDWFWEWWRTSGYSKDFWIETEDMLVRVHVAPRTGPFDPRAWKTSDETLKQRLLQSLGTMRVTEAVGCGSGDNISLHQEWRELEMRGKMNVWVGRSCFSRSHSGQTRSPTLSDPNSIDVHGLAMEDAESGVGQGVGGDERGRQPVLDGAGAAGDLARAPGGEEQAGGRVHQIQPGRAQEHVQGDEVGDAGEAYQGMPHEGAQGGEQRSRDVDYGLWPTHADLRGHKHRLPEVGRGGNGGEPQPLHAPGEARSSGKEALGVRGFDGECGGLRGGGSDTFACGKRERQGEQQGGHAGGEAAEDLTTFYECEEELGAGRRSPG